MLVNLDSIHITFSIAIPIIISMLWGKERRGGRGATPIPTPSYSPERMHDRRAPWKHSDLGQKPAMDPSSPFRLPLERQPKQTGVSPAHPGSPARVSWYSLLAPSPVCLSRPLMKAFYKRNLFMVGPFKLPLANVKSTAKHLSYVSPRPYSDAQNAYQMIDRGFHAADE